MEYVDGTTLADVIEEQDAMPWQSALPIFSQLLKAFDYAHERGIIHRDIKPRNIMLTAEGTVKVMDFGLAKFYLKQDATQTAGVSGTLCYMSPEQIRGRQLDQRSDLFSLGLTLYELLSGDLPFDRHDSQFGIQRAIVEGAFDAPHRLNAAVPERLSRIVMKALEKEPDRRYQRAREMLADLRTFADDTVDQGEWPTVTDVEARPEPDSFRLSQTWKRTLAGLALAVVLVGGGYAFGPSLWGALTGGAAPPEVETSPEQDAQNPENTPLNEEDRPSTDREAPLPVTDQQDDAATEATPPPEDPVAGDDGGAASSTPPEAESAPLSAETTPSSSDQQSAPDEEGPGAAQDVSSQEAAPPSADDEALAEEDAPPERPADSDAADDGPEEAPSPSSLVMQEARAMRHSLKDAILNDTWAGIPEPVATFYRDKLGGLSRKFRLQDAHVVVDDSRLQTRGAQIQVPVTVYIQFQQRGRDGTESLPIPSTWTWQARDGTVTLTRIQ